MSKEVLLQVKDLTLCINTSDGLAQPLSHISFDVFKGETFALVGESGCGKSLTASTIMRLLPESATVSSGTIVLGETELLSLTEQEMRSIRGGKIALIFQEPATCLNPVMTIGAQIVEMIRAHAVVSASAAKNEALRWLERVGITQPSLAFTRFPHEFSGGQKQRIMIAMALCAKPALIIADEPTTALDVTLQAQILSLLKDIQQQEGLTLILITHDLAVVQQMAHRVALMYAGELVEMSDSSSFFSQPAHPYACALLDALPSKDRSRPLHSIEGSVPSLMPPPQGCRFASRCQKASTACFATAQAMKFLETGHSVRCAHAPNAKVVSLKERQERETKINEERAATLLSIADLSVSYAQRGFWKKTPDIPVVKNLSLSISCGETLALVGESGSGKTTAAMAALGLLHNKAKVSGRVWLGNEEVFPINRAREQYLRQHAQIIFQDPFSSLDPRMTVRETLLEGMDSLRASWDKDLKERRIGELLDAVGLPRSAAERLPHEFSGGQRQRVAIARALSVKPKLIICDEPTSALDVSVQAQILNLLMQIQRSFGLAYLFITHNFAVVEYIADQVVVMKQGEVLEAGAASRVLNFPQHRYTQKLLASVPRLTLPS